MTRPYPEVYRREGPMNTGDLLTNDARSYPDQPAFVFEGTVRSYAQSCAGRTGWPGAAGRGLRGRPGRVVPVQLPEFMEVLYGVWKAGGVVVPSIPPSRPMSWPGPGGFRGDVLVVGEDGLPALQGFSGWL